LRYEVQRGDAKEITVRAQITQSEVDPQFVMLVPVYGDFGQGMVRLGQVAVAGNSTTTAVFHLAREPKKMALNVYRDVLER
jgi:hypothetical protein